MVEKAATIMTPYASRRKIEFNEGSKKGVVFYGTEKMDC
jgi:hypothetical protein